jgi:hypothetical protein
MLKSASERNGRLVGVRLPTCLPRYETSHALDSARDAADRARASAQVELNAERK